MDIEKKIKTLPDSPGVYLMKDSAGKIIYIGKANSLRKRVASHFDSKRCQAPKKKVPDTFCFCKTDVLMANVIDIEWIITGSEEEALLLEAALVKEKQPKFNVMLKDDKRYPLLKVTLNEKFPRLLIARRWKSDGAVYFGPYTSAKLLRSAVAVMRRIFPLRTCRRMPHTACLNYHIGQCAAPCIGRIDGSVYREIVDDAILFLKGRKRQLLERLSQKMNFAAEKKDFETAMWTRNQLRALSMVSRVPSPRDSGERVRVRGKVKNIPPHPNPLPPSGGEEMICAMDALGMSNPPIRIEGFDISNIAGREAVGSMVSFLNAKPDKSNYRRFRIKTVFSVDDYKMIQEVILRRYKRLLREGGEFPDMIVIDGGKGHVSAAKAVLDDLKMSNIRVFGIAKREDKIFSSRGEEHITGEFKQLIQRVRDEAHRFAQSYHHILRRKKIIGK